MVERTSRIAPKPTDERKPSPDSWVQGQASPEPSPPTPPKGRSTANGKTPAFPHRVSLDLSSEQYDALRRAAFELDLSQNVILREALALWLRQQSS